MLSNLSICAKESTSVTVRLQYLRFLHEKGAKNTEDRVDLGSIEVWNDQWSNWPVEMCELTKMEITKDWVDHKPMQLLIPEALLRELERTEVSCTRRGRSFYR